MGIINRRYVAARSLLAIAIAMSVMLPSAAHAGILTLTDMASVPLASTVAITEASAEWTILNEGSTASGTFVRGPSGPPLGAGSFRQQLTDGAHRQTLMTTVLDGTPLSAMTELGYSTFVAANQGGQASALRLMVDLTGDGAYTAGVDDALVFEPVYQTGSYPGDSVPNQCPGVPNCVAIGSWQNWDAEAGGWWSQKSGSYGPPLVTLTSYVAQHPTATLVTGSPSVRLQAGSGPGSWDAFDGNVDAVNLQGVTYDLDVDPGMLCVGVVVEAGCLDHFATIQAAINASAPGDSVVVGPGLYSENIVLWKNSFGAELNGLTLRADAGTQPVIDGSTSTGPGCTRDGTPDRSVVKILDVDDVTVQGFEIRGALDGAGVGNIAVGPSDDAVGTDVNGLTLRGNDIHDSGNDGIQFRYTTYGSCGPGVFRNILIENNIVRDNTDHCIKTGFVEDLVVRGNSLLRCDRGLTLSQNDVGAISQRVLVEGNRISGNRWQGIHVGSAAGDVVIRRNEIWGNVQQGIRVHWAQAETDPLHSYDVTIVNNTLHGNDSELELQVPSAPAAERSGHLSVVNNILAGSSGYGIYVSEGGLLPADSDFSNNNLFANPAGNHHDDDPAGRNLPIITDATDVTQTTDFADAGSGDFRLVDGAAAVDRGRAYTAPNFVPADVEFGGIAYDIGRWESAFALTLTTIDCDQAIDDAAAIQSTIDRWATASVGSAELRLRGICDVTRVPASGATESGVTNAAIVVPPNAGGVTITSDDPENPALILGSGIQAGIYVAPGNVGTTITKLAFNNLAQPIVVHNATDTTIGSDGTPPLGEVALEGNDILGGATMTAGILGLASRNESAAPHLVTDGAGRTRTFDATGAATLSGLSVLGNYVRFQPGGLDSVGISIYQKGPLSFASNIEIRSNAVGSTSPSPSSSNMVGVRVWATTDASVPAITDVRIQGNNLGRFEELSNASGNYGAGDVHSAGRFGILVNRAGDVDASGNGVRAAISTTPGLTIPGGGIVFSDVETGTIDGNGIIVLTDPQTAAVDLGAIGVIDNVGRLLGGGAQNGLATDNITVTGNVVGFVSTEGPIGAAKGLVVNGASNVNASGNEFKVISDRSIYIGAALQGFSANLMTVNEPARAVTGSRFCLNWLNTTQANAVDSPTSQIVFRSGISSNGNQFPSGHLYTGNRRC